MKTASRFCGKCSAEFFSDAPQEFCSACLLETGLFTNEDQGALNSMPMPSKNRAGHPLRAVTDFGDYELLEKLGRGGQGLVYRARQKSLNRIVALKIIGLGQWATKTHLRRFHLEAEAAASLDHPCIVPIYEIGERDGSCYFSMKLVEGGPIDEVVRREPMPTRRAAELIAKLARTVYYAHEQGILHRDIKPGNILLDAKGEPHLTDFGLARLVETESTVTHTMEVLGTPSYMAPEQARGDNRQLTSATDVYGLGAVFYQLLSGHPPFAGGTTYETVRLVLETEPQQPRLLNPKVDRDLATICLKCLEKDPQRRYPSALALLEDVERWLKDEPIKAQRTGVLIRANKWMRRQPAIAALIASLVALAAVVGWNIWHSELIRHAPTTGLAVLPFENLSEEKENAYFADGIQAELLLNLAKIKDLKVISRTSVMKYKSGNKRNLKEIAQQLGVSNVVEGSVRRSGNRVRVSIQLIDAQTDQLFWVQNYDRTLADSLALQGELATNIAAGVGATLSPQEKARVEAKPTNDPAAYDAYLRGRAFIASDQLDRANVEGAIRSYEEAVKLDPGFTLAWAYLSCAQSLSYWVEYDASAARLAAAKDATDRALALDPNLPETHLALGYYRYYGERDFTGALTEFQQAEQGLPNNSPVTEAIALIHRRLGQWDEAVAGLRRAVELDPRNIAASSDLAFTYRAQRRFPEAIVTADRVLALESTNTTALWIKTSVFWSMGDLQAVEAMLQNPGIDTFTRGAQALFQRRYAAATDILSKGLAITPDKDKIKTLFRLGLSQQRAGDVAGARATYQRMMSDIQRELEKVARDSFQEADLRGDLGLAYAGLGEATSAISEGQKAVAMHPASRDPLEGPEEEQKLAWIHGLLGDADHAIPILRRLLQVPYGRTPITPAWLRLDPVWDRIRNDPRFQELAVEK
jgi:serine/threonine protein kinase/cytochrome c-type biogenesis protein CcmH/NrfG